LSAEDLPDTRRWLDHNRWGVRFPLGDRLDALSSTAPYRFLPVEGDNLHQIAVGPVHAGIIEPGHFRFQCHGEDVFHLEISLGYQHRGAERTFIGGPNRRTIHTLETVAATLERLAEDSGRMVGIVTHVAALAERVPIRFVVSRTGATSTLREERT